MVIRLRIFFVQGGAVKDVAGGVSNLHEDDVDADEQHAKAYE
jgi:hypothetical protein